MAGVASIFYAGGSIVTLIGSDPNARIIASFEGKGLFVYEPPGYMRVAVIRSGPQTVLSMMYPLAGLVYLVIDGLLIFSKTRQCLHDRLARTVVILGTREWWTRSSTR
jgi:hypothetical protein